jgi:uncharacterized membrane protein YbhN (UPF0104 family)
MLVLIAIAPLAWAVIRQWTDLGKALASVQWAMFGSAVLLLVLLMPVMALTPWITLRYVGSGLSLGQVFRLYFVSQVAKYLPGGVWAFPGRMVAYRSVGVSATYSVVSVVWETIALFCGAACVGLLGVSGELRGAKAVQPVILVVALAVAAVLIIGQIPRMARWLATHDLLRGSTASVLANADLERLGVRWFPAALGASVLFWLLLGIPFRTLLLAAAPASETLSWIQAASMFSLAWCVGFVVIVVPAGLGIREGMLSLLLSGVLTPAAAIGAALLARVWWMLAEAVWILVATVWLAREASLPWEKKPADSEVPGGGHPTSRPR